MAGERGWAGASVFGAGGAASHALVVVARAYGRGVPSRSLYPPVVGGLSAVHLRICRRARGQPLRVTCDGLIAGSWRRALVMPLGIEGRSSTLFINQTIGERRRSRCLSLILRGGALAKVTEVL